MSPSICRLCYGLDPVSKRKLTTKKHRNAEDMIGYGLKASQLRASALGSESGKPCEVCALIRDSVETFFRGSGLLSKKHLAKLDADSLKYQVEIKNLAGKKKARNEDAPKAPSRLLLGVMCELNKGREEFELEIYAVPGAKVPPFLAKFSNAQEVLLNPTPEEYATTITKWLHECCEGHASCKAAASPNKPKPLPRRVLDLANDKVVLIETNHRPDLYVALSHCWGDPTKMLQMTKDNISHMMSEGIALENMPQTFRDAVQITRALGLRYLWIDSLCIIQGDKKDWDEQSAVMADIYAGCYLNLATTRSSEGTQGFIHPRWTRRKTPALRGCAITDAPDGETIGKCTVESFTVRSKSTPHLYDDSVRVRSTLGGEDGSSHETLLYLRWIELQKDAAPLIQRGWVYQERSLSPRTVHFHASEMLWDCASSHHCECAFLDSATLGGDGWSASKNLVSDLSVLDAQQLQGLWRSVVEDYTLLNLTYESDRLPALGGFATRFSEHMPKGDVYLAGLWKSNLGRDLLWKIEHGGSRFDDDESLAGRRRRRDPREKGPPSWSWASIAYGDDWPQFRYEYETKPMLAEWAETWSYKQDPRFSVIDASCSLDGISPFGKVTGGKITLKGAMCAMRVSKSRRPPPSVHLPSWASRVPVRNADDLSSLHLNYDDPNDGKAVENTSDPADGIVFCLFVGTFLAYFEHNKETHPEHKGLILKPSTLVAGAVERIGLWTQYIEHWAPGKQTFTRDAVVVTVNVV